jgi:hypothetical protein
MMPKLPTLPDDLDSREAAEVFEAVLMLEPYTTLCIYSYQNDRSRANLSVDVILFKLGNSKTHKLAYMTQRS